MDEKQEEREEEEEPPNDLGPSPPQSTTTDAPQSLLDDFGFSNNAAAPHTDSNSPCILMEEKEEEREEEASSDLVPSPPEPTTTIEAPQSLLDDFGFNIRLSSPHKGRDLPTKVHRRGNKFSEVSPSSELKTKYLMRFDTDLSNTHTKKKPTAVNLSPTKAQILMEFDTNLTPSDTDKDTPPSTEKVARALDNPLASPHLIEKNNDGQNLLDDFGFKVNLSNPLIGENSSEQKSEAQNLLDDFGFESNACTSVKTVENGMDLPIANITDAVVEEPLIAPPSTEVNANAQTLLDDFGFDINVSATRTSKTVPNAQLTDNHCTLPSSNGTPSKVVPLIAFSGDTVRLWEEKQKEDQSHTTITRHRSQSPSIDKADDQIQTPNDAQSSEKVDPLGDSVDRTVTSEKNDMVDGCSSVGEGEKMNDDGVEGREQSRLPTPSEQLTKCSPILTSVSVIIIIMFSMISFLLLEGGVVIYICNRNQDASICACD